MSGTEIEGAGDGWVNMAGFGLELSRGGINYRHYGYDKLRSLIEALPEALPPAKHVFTHVEWRLTGWRVTVPAQSAPAGCVWAAPADLEGRYALPAAFAAYRKFLLET